MMMRNDALIFDIDGTLWNACAASAKGWNLGLSKLGMDENITAEQIERVAGHPFEKCIELILPGLQDKLTDLLDILNDSEIEAVKSEGGVFYDGVIDGIKMLANSYNIFLVSNCQDWYMNVFLEFSGLETVIVDLDCHGMSGMPKHEMLSKMKRNYSLKNPVYIGDTDGDESAASLANMDFIHMSYGFGSTVKETVRFNTFTALVDYFERQSLAH
jgi:phosphoglycolate phosphatase